jgi:hypothetical protein
VNFTNGIAGLGISRRGNGAGIHNHDFGGTAIACQLATLREQLRLYGGGIRLGGPATELHDVK